MDDALLIRGPRGGMGPGSAEQRYALHRVRDTAVSPHSLNYNS